MTNLETTLSIILAFSLISNIALGVYARAAIVRLVSVAEELFDLREMSVSLTTHLQSVYDLEMFYGDETLKSLMDHSRSFAEQMDTFEYIFGIITEDDDKTETDQEDPTQAS
jgi:hypothetical protein|tara:strand:+ start:750 stop:1085 length:336 start_codon:yes stop_codon:yes gene_type:complete